MATVPEFMSTAAEPRTQSEQGDPPAVARVVLVGAGSMGFNHVRHVERSRNADLVAVVEPSAYRHELIRAASPCAILASIDELDLDKIDAAIIAAPTSQHCELAGHFLTHGISTLVEKPLCDSVEAGEKLVEIAEQTGTPLFVGHVERFNPAVIAARRYIAADSLGALLAARGERVGPFPGRSRDVGVCMDLATHDLDLLNHLTGSRPVRVVSATRREIHTAHDDVLLGTIELDNGAVASIEASRISAEKRRTLLLTYEQGVIDIDFLNQRVRIATDAGATGEDDPWPVAGRFTDLLVQRAEPLGEEIEAFVRSVIDAPETPLATGRDGLRAVMAAEALLESAETRSWVSVSGLRPR